MRVTQIVKDLKDHKEHKQEVKEKKIKYIVVKTKKVFDESNIAENTNSLGVSLESRVGAHHSDNNFIAIDIKDNKQETLKNTWTKKDNVRLDKLIQKMNRAIHILEAYCTTPFPRETHNFRKRYQKGRIFFIVGALILGILGIGLGATVLTEKLIWCGVTLCLLSCLCCSTYLESHSVNQIAPFSSILNDFVPEEQEIIKNIAQEFDIELSNQTVIFNLLHALKMQRKQLEELKQGPLNMLAFLQGSHKNAKESIVHKAFFQNPLYSKNVTSLIFQYSGFSEPTSLDKKRAAKKVFLMGMHERLGNESPCYPHFFVPMKQCQLEFKLQNTVEEIFEFADLKILSQK